MRFGLSDDQQEIQKAARQLLTKRCGFDIVRKHAEAGTRDDDLHSELADLGWHGIGIPEAFGGGGLGLVEACLLVEAHGYALAPTPLFGTIAAAAFIEAAGTTQQKEQWLPGLATAALTGAVGSPELVVDSAQADVAIITRDTSAVAVGPEDVRPIATIDPTRRYGELTGTATEQPFTGNAAAGAARLRILAVAELVGTAHRAIDMTLDYVKQRQQFGRPVGSFQAVSHRCVQMYLATEAARTATYYAAWAADADDERVPEATALATSLGCDAAKEATGSAIQLHGGIGFTWEADLHWLYKRAQLTALLAGGSARGRGELARMAAARLRQEPAVEELQTQ